MVQNRKQMCIRNGPIARASFSIKDPRAIGPSVYRTLGLTDPRSKGPSVYRAVALQLRVLMHGNNLNCLCSCFNIRY